MTHTDTAGNLIDETALYAALYVENLRTKVARQYAIVKGADALKMLARSTDPRRLAFSRI